MGKREYESAIILALILFFAFVGNCIMPMLVGSNNYLYYIKPLYWILFSVYILLKPRTRFKGKLKVYGYIITWSVIFGIVYLTLYFAGGFLDGIGASPYTRSIIGIISNTVCFGGVILMMEWVRNYIINRVKKKYVIVFAVATVIVFTIYSVNLRVIMNLGSWQFAVQYLGEFVLPEVAKNVLLTYMVYIGGVYPAMVYSAITSVPVWLTPVLPNLKWITRAFFGIMLPVVFMIVLRQLYKKHVREIKIRELKREKPYSWVSASVVAVIIIWFSVGVFPVFPTVVLTGSMKPTLNPGDVAIMRKYDDHIIETGDVVQYWTGEYYVIHRVIEKDTESGKYKTKGDNNSSPDLKPVGQEQIRGKMMTKVPKIGMLSLILRSRRSTPETDVE